jgi:diguanylate cyclase (GGDEF)-like protein/putative nucleotidyltransferase with HDIG domain
VRGKRQAEDLEHRLALAQRRIAELERELASRALLDPLTGLPTVQAFGHALNTEVERSRRHGHALAVAALDIDGFSAVNAAHGHSLGDDVLRAVAAALARHTRESDVVCRPAADDFLVIFPETSGAEAKQAFERLLVELEALRVGPLECVSVSVGIADWNRNLTANALIGLAEERVHRARAAGGGRAEAGETAQAPSHPGDSPEGHSDAIAGLAEALTERDRYTGEHSEEVLELVEQVARGLALDEAEVQRTRYAALLHDIGKVAIPDDILHKPAPLDDREWEIMREHPVIGERILRAIPGLGGVARIVRHEHERFDGTGYPDGLKGDEIPIGARIILACDAYHAMVSDRPYRKAMPHAEAIRELARGAGKQFDPQVTEILIGCLYSSRQVGGGPATVAAA